MAEKVQRVHIDRKDLRAPDPFFEAVGGLRKSLAENRNAVIAAGVAVLLLFVGVLALNGYRARRTERAAAAFYRATESVATNSLEAAKTVFADLNKNGAQPYRDLAVLYGADIAVREQRWDDALSLYQGFVDVADNDYLRQIGVRGHAYALEMAGDLVSASKRYAEAAEIDGPYTLDSLLSRIRTADKLGDTAAADEAAAALVQRFPEAEQAEELAARTQN